MKKVLSIALALCMMLTLTVCAVADDTLLWQESPLFFTSANWSDPGWEVEDPETFLEALQVEGAVLSITRDTEVHVEFSNDPEDIYEMFVLIDTWYSSADVGYVWLGTSGHGSEDEPDKYCVIDCLSDDGVTATYDANAVYAAYEALGCLDAGNPKFIICTSEVGTYKVVDLSIYVPETTEEETTEEAEASETSETTESSESSETSTASSPDTGVALALVPMALAGIAVVSTKRR